MVEGSWDRAFMKSITWKIIRFLLNVSFFFFSFSFAIYVLYRWKWNILLYLSMFQYKVYVTCDSHNGDSHEWKNSHSSQGWCETVALTWPELDASDNFPISTTSSRLYNTSFRLYCSTLNNHILSYCMIVVLFLLHLNLNT